MVKRVSILLIIAVLVLAGSWYALRHFEAAMLDTKTVRSGRGIVERKQHIIFDRTNNQYRNQHGQFIMREIGTEEYRLYYRVIDFGSYPKRKQEILENTERRRVAENNLRFTIVSKDIFDSTRVGDEIRFNSQFVFDNDVMTF